VTVTNEHVCLGVWYGVDWKIMLKWLLKTCFVRSLYALPNIIREIKSRRMKWAGHVARVGDEKCIHYFV